MSSRRQFLKTLGAGLLIAIAAEDDFAQVETFRRGRGGGRPVSLAARLHVGANGRITVMTGKVECGQGSRASVTQATAEEMCVSPDSVDVLMGDTDLCPDDGGTFGSQTTPRTIPAIRQAAAEAMQILIRLACEKWNVEASTVHVNDGSVVCTADGRKIGYAELVGGDSAKAFTAARAGRVTVTAVSEWKVLGQPMHRRDARDLVTGRHTYPSDIVLPGMLYGKVLRPPSYRATLKAIDVATAKHVVVVRDESFVGVAAEKSFLAERAVTALAQTAQWEEKPQVSSDQLFEHLKSTANGLVGNPFADDLSRFAKAVRQNYHVSYVQHAPLEPRAAVANWKDGKLTVWTGSQNPGGVRSELQREFGLASPSQVRVIIPDFGGGFGGKHQGDAAVEAARLAKAAGRPVWVRWTREEEFTWAYFRPAALIVAEAGIAHDGKIDSWHFVNVNSGPAGLESPYLARQRNEQFVQADPPLRQGSYRALASTANHFARESLMDELADAAGNDPLSFRLDHLTDQRLIAVLNAAAGKFDFNSRWKRKGENVGVGLACGTEKGSYVAACAEVVVDPKTNEISVRRVCQAFECGKILNPGNLLSQVQGAIVMGLGPALREEVQFANGRVTNGTFNDYLVPRFADLPELDVQLLDRPDMPSAGAGETPIVAIAPAIANAVFHVTGVRVRQMPIRLRSSSRTA